MPTRVSTARIAVGVVGAAAAAVFLASVPAAFRRTASVCAAAEDCPAGRLTPEAAGELADLGLTPAGYSFYVTALVTVLAVVFLAAAALLLRVPGRSTAVVSTSAALVLLGVSFPQTLLALGEVGPHWQRAADVVEASAVVVLTWWVVSFPDARGGPRWTRWLVLAVAVDQAARLAGWHVDPALDTALTSVWVVVLAVTIVVRYRATDAAERDRIRFMAYGVAVALGGLLVATVAQSALGAVPGTLADLLVQALVVLSFMAIPLSVAAALLRRGLWGVEASVARALTYGLLTVAVTAGYIVTMAAVAGALATGRTASAAAAGGLLALLVHPAHLALRSGVDRLLYGDPERVERALAAAELQPDAPAGEALASFAELVTRALSLPYARLVVGDVAGQPADRRWEGSAGRLQPGWPVDEVPLLQHGRHVGTLAVARRDVSGPADPRDVRALDAVTRQAASLAGAVLVSEQLRAARTQLVTAREEERRRLRNDLHDGLGPALGAVNLKLAAAANRLNSSPAAARELLDEARRQTGDMVDEVRRLVQGLRPPAVDELGLVGAVKAFASRMETGSLAIRIHASQEVADLPAAVEVAAYRIIMEALNNVLQHASASSCEVEVRCSRGALLVTVTDDGTGINERPGRSRDGVGLASMSDRATELCGRLRVEAAPDGGTRVCAVLPLGQVSE